MPYNYTPVAANADPSGSSDFANPLPLLTDGETWKDLTFNAPIVKVLADRLARLKATDDAQALQLSAPSAAIGDTSISDTTLDATTTTHVVFSGNGGATVACDSAGLALSCPAELDVTSSGGNVVVSAGGQVQISATGNASITSSAGSVAITADTDASVLWGGVNVLVKSASGAVQLGDSAATATHVVAALAGEIDLVIGTSPIVHVDALGQKMQAGIITHKRVVETFAATMTIDLSAGKIHEVTLTANLTSLTLSNMVDGGEYTLAFIQDATGSRTLSVPANMKPAGGSLVLSTGAGKRDVVTFYSDGTNLYERARSMNE